MKQIIKFDNVVLNLELVLMYEFFSNSTVSLTLTTGEKKEINLSEEQYAQLLAYLNRYWYNLDNR